MSVDGFAYAVETGKAFDAAVCKAFLFSCLSRFSMVSLTHIYGFSSH